MAVHIHSLSEDGETSQFQLHHKILLINYLSMGSHRITPVGEQEVWKFTFGAWWFEPGLWEGLLYIFRSHDVPQLLESQNSWLSVHPGVRVPWLEGLPSSIGATLARKRLHSNKESWNFLIDLLNFIFYIVNVYGIICWGFEYLCVCSDCQLWTYRFVLIHNFNCLCNKTRKTLI